MNTAVRKNKIQLSDYDYRRDIVNRLLMSDLTDLDVEVIQEILNGSLTTSVQHLAEALDLSEEEVEETLTKMAPSRLFTRQGSKILIDKELRKYYEFQMAKFDENFVPDIEFIIMALSKVPIHALPSWYSISRMSDNIYASIIEKHLHTPKIYERYLMELQFEDPILKGIMKEVFSSSEFKVYSHDLRKKYALSRERFEELMLLLEYQFVCYLSYEKKDSGWEEVVTPFYEWKEYLLFQKNTLPTSISSPDIQKFREGDFTFIREMGALLKASQQAPLPIEEAKTKNENHFALSVASWLPILSSASSEEKHRYLQPLLRKLLVLQLGRIQKDHFFISEHGQQWLKKTEEEQAMALYRHPMNQMAQALHHPVLYTEKAIREIEKSLRRVTSLGWVDFEDFLKGIMVPIGHYVEGVSLQKKGKRWRYMLPMYSPEEKKLIEDVIFERLFEVGMVEKGTHGSHLCFRFTPFGRQVIG